jgi:DNA repair exonuclease SbcCD ATPase subunit
MSKIKKRKTGGKGIMIIDEDKRQLIIEQLKKEADIVRSTLDNKREDMKTLICECKNLENELFHLKEELNAPYHLVNKFFKEIGNHYETYYYIYDIDEKNKKWMKVIKIYISDNHHADIAISTISDIKFLIGSSETIVETSLEEFMEAINKANSLLNSILKENILCQ